MPHVPMAKPVTGKGTGTSMIGLGLSVCPLGLLVGLGFLRAHDAQRRADHGNSIRKVKGVGIRHG